MTALGTNAMKVAMQTHSIRHHLRGRNPTPAEMTAIFDWASRAGFDGIDISDSWDFSTLSRSEAMALRQMSEELGLAIPSVNCIGKNLCDDNTAQRHIAEIKSAVDVASWLGSKIVNVSLSVPRTAGVVPVIGARLSPGGSREASERDYEVSAAGLRKIAHHAAAKGLEVSVELHDRSIADTSASLLKILEMVGELNVKANPDLSNGYRAYDTPSETWQNALTALAPHANIWHVNNLQRVHFAEIQRSAFVECDLGAGDIDYVWALNLMRAAGFGGWIVIEYKGLGCAFEMLARGRKFLSRIFDDPAIGMLQARFGADPDDRPSSARSRENV